MAREKTGRSSGENEAKKMKAPGGLEILEALKISNKAEARWRAAKKSQAVKAAGVLDVYAKEMGQAAEVVRALMRAVEAAPGSAAAALALAEAAWAEAMRCAHRAALTVYEEGAAGRLVKKEGGGYHSPALAAARKAENEAHDRLPAVKMEHLRRAAKFEAAAKADAAGLSKKAAPAPPKSGGRAGPARL